MSVSKRGIAFYTGLAVFTFVWTGAFSLLGMDLHHDGVMFKAAADVAAGKWVFSGTFCQYGLLSPLLQGAFLKIFGTELAVLKLLTAAFYAGIAVLCDLLWRRFLTPLFRAVQLLMFFSLAPYLLVPFHIWSSVYALFFMLLAAEFFLLADEKKNLSFMYFSGVCALLVFGFRQPCGAVTLAAQILALLIAWRSRDDAALFRRKLAALLAGAGTTAAVFACYLTLGHAWRDYFRQTVSFVGGFAFRRGGGGAIYPLVEAFLPHTETMNFIFAFIPLAALGLFFFSCRKIFSAPRTMAKDLPLIAMLLFGLASYHQYYPVPCVRHLYWGAVPMFGAYALLMQRIASGADLRKKVLYLSLLALPLLWAGGLRMYGGLFRLSEFFVRTPTDVPGLRYIRHGRGEQYICRIAADIRNNLPPVLKQRGVFNCTADGIWSVVLPPVKGFDHPMFVNWKADVYGDYPQKALSFIDRVRPAVLASTPFFHPDYVKVFEFSYMGVNYTFHLPVAPGS